MEKIVSKRNYREIFKSVPKGTPSYQWLYWAGASWLIALIVVAVLVQAASIGGREAPPQAPASYLAAPPSDSDSISVQWTPTLPDGRIWVDLTPGRSGLTN